MMISPEQYIKSLANRSYTELIKERDLLIRDIRRFEKNSDRNGEEWSICPSPDVIYQVNLKYLAKLCEHISDVYNRECDCEEQTELVTNNSLLEHIEEIHTTELGAVRIKKNLSLTVDDVTAWCIEKIKQSNASIIRSGKNWYISVDGCKITVNATSYTIITAHKEK